MGAIGWFNRGMDRLSSWFGWQLGIIQGRSRPTAAGGFQPSLATGAMVLAALAYQVVSGGLLLVYYQPSVYATLTPCGQPVGLPSTSPAAWCSTYYLDHSVPMGNVLLTSHLYGAYVVIFLVMVHLFRGFYAGSYKRAGAKFGWMAGTLLLLLVLAMGFTGYLLAYTQLSYNATQVSITLLQSLPLIGTPLASLVVGDGSPQSLLSRMFALHVFLLPAALLLFAFLHKGSPLFPHVVRHLVKWGFLYVGLLLGFASLWLWSLPTYAGDLSSTPAVTVPAWYFLWVFKLVDFAGVTPGDVMVFVAALFLFLFFLPLLDRSRSADLRDRPVFLFLGNSMLGFFILMTAWGDVAPGVPISAADAALRLGPVVAVNAVAVTLFYRRYRRADRKADVDAGTDSNLSPSAKQTRVGSSHRSAGSGGATARTPVALSMTALLASLFLLAFGLWLPFLFLLGALLVDLAESSRRAPHNGSAAAERVWLFPTVSLVAIGALLGAIALTIAL